MATLETQKEKRAFIARLSLDYPKFVFKESSRFSFRPPKTINYSLSDDHFALQSLHELGHALSGHRSFDKLVQRLKMEREAWEKARSLAPKYHISWDEDYAEDQLDTYRDWLHQKSKCPSCGQTRYQNKAGIWLCPNCDNLAN